MLAVYRMFRVVHSANPKNQSAMFSIPKPLATHFADASMQMCEARASAIASGDTVDSLEAIRDTEPLYMTTENIAKEYPLFSSSLLNLIQNSEKKIGYKASKR